jgi:hypothetical protein
MWFNPHAKLVEIAGQPPATSATTATKTSAVRPVSQLSQLSQPLYSQRPVSRVAEVASVATPRAPEIEPNGGTAGGRVATWTGRVVSLDDWRLLTAWERHGPNGRHWNGITKQWEQPEGGEE